SRTHTDLHTPRRRWVTHPGGPPPSARPGSGPRELGDLLVRQRAVEEAHVVHVAAQVVDLVAAVLRTADDQRTLGGGRGADVLRGDPLAVNVERQRPRRRVPHAREVVPAARLRLRGRQSARADEAHRPALVLPRVLQEERAVAAGVLADHGLEAVVGHVEPRPRRDAVRAVRAHEAPAGVRLARAVERQSATGHAVGPGGAGQGRVGTTDTVARHGTAALVEGPRVHPGEARGARVDDGRLSPAAVRAGDDRLVDLAHLPEVHLLHL